MSETMLFSILGLLCTLALAWCHKTGSDLEDVREENKNQGDRLAALEALMSRLKT
jgi:hypothetical protein